MQTGWIMASSVSRLQRSDSPEAGVCQDRMQAGALWLSLALHFAAGEGTNGSTAEAGGGVAMAEGGSMAMAERHHGYERGSMAEGEDP